MEDNVDMCVYFHLISSRPLWLHIIFFVSGKHQYMPLIYMLPNVLKSNDFNQPAEKKWNQWTKLNITSLEFVCVYVFLYSVIIFVLFQAMKNINFGRNSEGMLHIIRWPFGDFVGKVPLSK